MRRNQLLCWSFFAAAAMLAPVSVSASTITSQTFDTDPTLGSSQAPGVWYTDRYAPAGFESVSFLGDNRLKHTISASDSESGRPGNFSSSFYNTQGRKFDTPGASTISIDFYIDPAFDGASGRTGGFWGTGFDSGGNTTFPIIEFFDNQFQVFDSVNDSDGTGFRTVGVQSGFAFGEFVTLTISLDSVADLFSFSVNGELLSTEEAGGAVEIGNVILQNINTADGVDRMIYWDNLTASGDMQVPVPATMAFVLVGLAGIATASLRRRAGSASDTGA